MTLDELNTVVATTTEKSKAEAARSVQAVLQAITDAVVKKEKVSIAGFGVFETSFRPERLGRNPQTGKEIKIAASTTVKFKPGKTLRDKVNS
ncbi:HU family DNA-binding protein [Arboricoccus pini]|uniref:HU family DNA-binding protein n=1 Tax=Arboricoccus pini TaxID=1963835 RepID=A0A212Q013_9PROT|nr:HU family DNA-binding protein [Arboricoccus pini]SNB52579.1 HU family DNA-binding protein [Arboricoccus pini]